MLCKSHTLFKVEQSKHQMLNQIKYLFLALVQNDDLGGSGQQNLVMTEPCTGKATLIFDIWSHGSLVSCLEATE